MIYFMRDVIIERPLLLKLRLYYETNNHYKILLIVHYFIIAEYEDIGDPVYICNACKAKFWRAKAMRGNKSFTKKYILYVLFRW